MIRIRSLLKSIHKTVWLGLLTLFLVTVVFPATAESHLKFALTKREVKREIITLNQQNYPELSLLEQGRRLFANGRFAEAVSVWQQAVNRLQGESDRTQLALTLNYLANAYQELGQWQQAKDAITQSLTLLQAQSSPNILAQTLNTQGNIQFATGQTEAALSSWQQAEKAYSQAGDETGFIGSKINQAQALQALGLYRRSKQNLEELNTKLQSLPNTALKAMGLRSLGVALQVVGDLTRSQEVLNQSLAISQQLNSDAETSTTLLSLANTLRALKKPQEALVNYQKAAETASNPLTKLEARLNELSLLVETKNLEAAKNLLPEIELQIEKIPLNRESIYAQVNFANTLIKMGYDPPAIAQVLATAIKNSRQLQDLRAESFALGQLGKLYQQTQQSQEAQNLTKQALTIAQQLNAADIMARLQSQMGEILQRRGDVAGAISAYTESVNTLKSLRTDLVAINPDIQFSFQESVEPVYRQLVSLLLKSNPDQNKLKQAREVIESLQIAELDNFFREACLDAKPQQIDRLDPQAAVIYPIILPDRLEVIVSQPGKPLRQYTTNLPQAEVEKTLVQLLESLNPFFSSEERLRVSQQVYDWLIKPAEAELAANGVKTLVFVQDGILRNLPMSALYDGKSYLLEKYNIALAPGLSLVAPQSLSQKKIKVLTGGITESRQGFSALPGVEIEVNKIAQEVPSKVFLNQEFTEKNLQSEIAGTAFPIVHLATHGQFSSNPEETFILTWDEKVKVKEFETLLRYREQGNVSPIELLVLSACQTAAGDKRAALGLAGVAVRSGARSTLATLWSVKDESTAQLMTEFYQLLSQGNSKAEALRTAQLKLLKQSQYNHPFYWAPFIIVGNWL
ncbi:CHAT domain-containing protein [Aerosakkonemataceae cyanobacterium BLCC-F50]|uniref:CHAT domain-containing protein n=1 Tax=Floridaenema flaviceps BLCC-F50 TaxID=3153642 RepID=A0ABV4XQL5_9CYAN